MKATGRAASRGAGERGDGGRAGRDGAEPDEERPRGALGVNQWYLGYNNRPGPRVYSDFFSQVKRARRGVQLGPRRSPPRDEGCPQN